MPIRRFTFISIPLRVIPKILTLQPIKMKPSGNSQRGGLSIMELVSVSVSDRG